VLACNNGAGLHPKDVDRLRAAICQAIYEGLQPPPEPKPETTLPTW